MNRILNNITLLAAFCLVFSACLPPKTIGTSGEDSYNEDLSELRRTYADSLSQAMQNGSNRPSTAQPETPQLNAAIDTRYSINDQLDDFIYDVTSRNQDNNTYQGYTVQVYTGSSRDKANSAKTRVYGILPEASPRISFDPPNYKVKIGEFTDRLEAQPIYSELKNAFQVVLIVPERFPIVPED